MRLSWLNRRSKEENIYLEDIVDLEDKLSSHDRIVYKMGQSIKTIHMLGKRPKKVYDPFLKAGLGYQYPEHLKKVIVAQPKMYDCERFHNTKLIIDSPDYEEALGDAEESRIKMKNKMIQFNYAKLNALYETFVPQKEFSTEQTYFSTPSTSIVSSESSKEISYLPTPKMPNESKLLKMFDEMNEAILALRKNIDRSKELKQELTEEDKLKTIEKGKNVNTKFDKFETLRKLRCVTPLNTNTAVKAKKVSSTKVNTDRSKRVTSHSTPKNEQSQKQIESSNSVKRPKSKDTKSKNRVLKNTNVKSPSTNAQKVSSSVSVGSSKRETMNSTICQSNANVLKTNTVNVVNDGSNIVCVSCGKDVFMLSHEKCVTRYALSVDSRVKRALFTSPVAAKSRNLRATSVVAKFKFSVAKTPIVTNKVSSASSLSPNSSQSLLIDACICSEAYVQQLDSSRIKLTHLEQELKRAPQQVHLHKLVGRSNGHGAFPLAAGAAANYQHELSSTFDISQAWSLHTFISACPGLPSKEAPKGLVYVMNDNRSMGMLQRLHSDRIVVTDNGQVAELTKSKTFLDLVNKNLGKVVPSDDNFYAALNSAIFSDGSFVYIPKDTKCPMQILTYFRINAMETGQFERTLIVADNRSFVEYLEGCTAPSYDTNQLHAAVVQLHCNEEWRSLSPKSRGPNVPTSPNGLKCIVVGSCDNRALGSYACNDSLFLTPLCCDDIHEVTPRISALARCDKLSLNTEGLSLRRIEEKLTKKQVGGEWIIEREMTMISKEGTISKFPEYHSSEEEEPTEQPRLLNKYGFVDHPELQRNEFAPRRLPQGKGNMNGWLNEDEDEPLEYKASDKEVESDLESTASSKPQKTAKDITDRTFRNCPYCSK
ncbi:retrovirus-related pol polyprotein from transposon TNT 1-94 [Tanacetum coccineum]